jgi:hypothetical protein
VVDSLVSFLDEVGVESFSFAAVSFFSFLDGFDSSIGTSKVYSSINFYLSD